MKLLTRSLLLALAVAGTVAAEDVPAVAAPEIDATTAASAIALIAGGALVLRSRRK